MWRNAYDSGMEARSAIVKLDDGSYKIDLYKKIVKGDAAHQQTIYVIPDGSMRVVNNFMAIGGKHPLLLRAGNDLVLNKEYNSIQWYGRGPGENYWDRKTASFIGQYRQSIDEQYFPYARPQESGNKTEVRWVSFSNAKGKR